MSTYHHQQFVCKKDRNHVQFFSTEITKTNFLRNFLQFCQFNCILNQNNLFLLLEKLIKAVKKICLILRQFLVMKLREDFKFSSISWKESAPKIDPCRHPNQKSISCVTSFSGIWNSILTSGLQGKSTTGKRFENFESIEILCRSKANKKPKIRSNQYLDWLFKSGST